MKKRITAILLAVLMLVGMIPTAGAAGVTAERMVSKAESVLGEKYSYFGFGADWCALFVGWCAKQLGFTDVVGTKASYPCDFAEYVLNNRTGTVYYFKNTTSPTYDNIGKYLSKNCTNTDNLIVSDRSTFIPQPGDLVCFRWDTAGDSINWSHIGIVESADSSKVYYIEGNGAGNFTSGVPYYQTSTVHRNSRELNDLAITTYIRPNYADQSVSLQGTNFHGSDFTSGELAQRLETILYSGMSGSWLVGTFPSVYTSSGAMTNSFSTDYMYTIKPASGHGSTWSGWQCAAYGQAAFYVLFGYRPSAETTSGVVDLPNIAGKGGSSINYTLFHNAGVHFGDYIRTTGNSNGSYSSSDGHSMILLSYSEDNITVLEGNGNKQGLVDIWSGSWASFRSRYFSSRYLSYITQVVDSVYNEYLGGAADQKLSKPTNMKISLVGTDGTYTFRISWNAVSGAAEYERQYLSSGGTWNNFTNITNPSATQFDAEGFTKRENYEYKFRVRAKNGSNVSDWTEISYTSSHQHGNYSSVVTQPTCTDGGYTTYTCSCGYSYTGNATSALGHAWNGGAVTTQPTNAAAGVKTYTCTRCGAKRTESVPPLNSDWEPNWSDWSASAVSETAYRQVQTKTQYGYYHYIIRYSDGSVGGYPIQNHSVFEGKVSDEYHSHWVDSPLTARGKYLTYNGKDYMEYFNDICTLVPASGATTRTDYMYSLADIGEADTRTVYRYRYIRYNIEYNANGGSGAPEAQKKTHGTNLTLSSVKPTRTDYTFKGWATSPNGTVAYAPGASYSADSGATLYAIWEYSHQHTFSSAWTKDSGYHWHAATCAHTGEISGKAAHAWNGGTVTRQPTHTAMGEKTFTCTVCGATKTELIDCLSEHTFDQKVTDERYLFLAATCEHPARYFYSCACGASGSATFESGTKLPHTYSEEYSYSEAHPHTRIHSCTECGHVEALTGTMKNPACRDCYVKVNFDCIGGSVADAIRLPTTDGLNLIDGYNVMRDKGQLIVYNYSGELADTNKYGAEALVNAAGKVTELRSYGDDNQRQVPEGGFILSGHSPKSNFVELIQLGDYVGVDYDTDTATIHTTEESYLYHNKMAAVDGKLGKLPTPVKDGCAFKGWYTAPSGGSRVDADTTVTAHDDLTLYAQWEQLHTHTFSSAWTHDETHHWHAATCEHTDEVSDKAAHTWDNGAVTTQPTTTAEGVKTFTCTVCGATKTEPVEKLHAHTFSADWTHDETHHWHAATCEHTDEVSGKAVHTWDGGTVTTQPTTTSEGVKTFTCTVCGATKTEPVEKLTETVDETKPYLKASAVRKNAGKTVDVTVSLANNPGIWGMDVKVGYDASVMTLTAVTNGTVFADTERTEGNLAGDPYILSYECAGFDNTTASGVLATMTFRIKEDAPLGVYPITVSCTDGNAINADEQTVHFQTVNGSVEVIKVIFGDVNDDGEVSKADSLRLKKYLAGQSVVINEAAADVTADGAVSKADSLRLKKYLAGQSVTLGE